MNDIFLGNLCSLLAMISDSASARCKTTRSMLLVQCISQVIYGVGSVLLKGYSAAVQNAVGIIRNLSAIKERPPKWLEYSLLALGVVLGVCFNNRGLMGWLPILGNLQYSLAVFRFRGNERALKIAFLISAVMFTVFNIVLLNVVGMISNAVIIITTVTSLLQKEGTN